MKKGIDCTVRNPVTTDYNTSITLMVYSVLRLFEINLPKMRTRMVRNPTVSSNSLVVNPHVRTPTTESAQASLRASVDEFQTPLLLLREPRLDEQNYDLALLSSLHTIVFNCLVNTVVRFSELLPHAGHIMNLSLSRESSRSSAIA